MGMVGFSWTGTLSTYTQLVIMFMGVNIIMSSSLNLINGYMGEFSCGHAGFMALGAYTSSLLTVWFFTKGSVFGANLLPPGWSVWIFPFTLTCRFEFTWSAPCQAPAMFFVRFSVMV